MPGSDDQYDQVHTYSQDHAGKSKTTKPAVREIGRDGAPVQLFVGQDIDESSIRTPPANVRFLFFNTSGNLRKKNPDGSVDSAGGGAPADASYVTTVAESGLSNETVADNLADVFGSPVTVGSGSNLDLTGGGGVDDDAGNVITDFVGQGLELASNSLQILSTIWDGTNIVGDVDNSSVTTDQATLNGADGHTIGGDTLGGFPSSTSGAGLTLGGGFTELNANRPVLLAINIASKTDGTTGGDVRVEVDNSGGSTSDYRAVRALADSDAGSGVTAEEAALVYVPPAGTVNVANTLDPNNVNTIVDQQTVTL